MRKVTWLPLVALSLTACSNLPGALKNVVGNSNSGTGSATASGSANAGGTTSTPANQPPGAITGKVQVDGGANASGATVTLSVNASGSNSPLTATTAADGTFAFPSVAQATYSATFAKAPFFDQTVTVAVVSGATASVPTVTLHATPPSLSGAGPLNPKRDLVAYVQGNAVYVGPLGTAGVQFVAAGSQAPSNLTWSPDGTKLAYVENPGNKVHIVDCSDPLHAGTNTALSADSQYVAGLAWTPDSARVAYLRSSASALFLGDATGTESSVTVTGAPSGFGVNGAAFVSPKIGGANYFTIGGHDGSNNGALYEINLTSGAVRGLTTPSYSTTYFAAGWTPDGGRLYDVNFTSGGVAYFNGTSSTPLSNGYMTAALSPDGQYLAYSTSASGNENLVVQNVTTGAVSSPLATIALSAGSDYSLSPQAWAFDDSALLYTMGGTLGNGSGTVVRVSLP